MSVAHALRSYVEERHPSWIEETPRPPHWREIIFDPANAIQPIPPSRSHRIEFAAYEQMEEIFSVFANMMDVAYCLRETPAGTFILTTGDITGSELETALR